MGDLFNQPFALEPAEVVRGLPAPVGRRQERTHPLHELSVGKTGHQVAEPHHGSQNCHDSLFTKTGSRCIRPSSVVDGWVTRQKVATSGAGCASAASALQKHRLADWPTPRRAYQFAAQTRRPIPKSLVSQITVSVRKARPSLEVLLDSRGPVVTTESGIDS